MPIHEAHRKQVGKEVGLKFGIRKIMVVIPQIREIEFLVRSSRHSLKIIVTVVELTFPNMFRGLWVAENAHGTPPVNRFPVGRFISRQVSRPLKWPPDEICASRAWRADLRHLLSSRFFRHQLVGKRTQEIATANGMTFEASLARSQ